MNFWRRVYSAKLGHPAVFTLALLLFFSQMPLAVAQDKKGGYKINVDVNLVVLRTTVRDKKGNIVDGLAAENFRVFEDNVQQRIAVFNRADIPLTLGIVIDDSGSMRDKRADVVAAANYFVKASNRDDQVFIVNFSYAPYLDTEGSFVSSEEGLQEALEKIDSRGRTALYDAIYASLGHIVGLGERARDRRALIVITDGEDNESIHPLTEALKYAQQKGDAAIYSIGLMDAEDESNSLFKLGGGGARRAAKILKKLAEATGGEAVFPKKSGDLECACAQIAAALRNQYTLGYYPSNDKKDGAFRAVRVEVFSGNRKERFNISTKPGYYAPAALPAGR